MREKDTLGEMLSAIGTIIGFAGFLFILLLPLFGIVLIAFAIFLVSEHYANKRYRRHQEMKQREGISL
jgi:uncharacterized membrane protein